MTDCYGDLAVTEYANVLAAKHFLSRAIKPLWPNMPRIAGPAYTVQLAPGDHLMLHAAIYEAPKGSVIVVDGADCSRAVAGGNVCAIAKQRGILGFIVDGVIRDLGEITDMAFPVYAQGVFPVPGQKKRYFDLAQPIQCGGVSIRTGDIMVADREGIVAIPKADASSVWQQAKQKYELETRMTLAEWQTQHETKVTQALLAAKTPS
ncbi:RraA family protein [Neiella marina]|uniref:Putative 4-hydroxy-4-methyl-2-oxoglutarate aldolase n=1 Tax=Neiella holothuriorum TaxID=2870530 RepID=A0ABS7EDX4_9GAMM|nr:RraA family protein [Neiella holothuriorum]MBW8190525.1 RraA family protein [Neiella holothuriorum]